jgi:hypothetical protein
MIKARQSRQMSARLKPAMASSSGRNGVSAASLPVAKPPWATSSVTHAGVPDTGVRDPTVGVPSAIPARTERHHETFASSPA